MPTLVVVCPHCLTWAEPHADRCSECGVVLDIDAPDPDEEAMVRRLGTPVLELGPVQLDRLDWPSLGHLVVTTEGLLFLPDFVQRPNGAIEPLAEEPEKLSNWSAQLFCSWWLLSRAQPTPAATAPATDTGSPMLPRLFNAPGGLFVARSSVRRLHARWNHLQIERRPARSVTLRPVPRGLSISTLLKQLRELPAWRGV